MIIDWNATGSMISGIGTWAAAILAAIVALVLHNQTLKIGEEGNKKLESEIKISLYDKRYIIYQCFTKYYNNYTIHDTLPINLDRKEKEWMIIRGKLFDRIVDIEWMENLNKILFEPESDLKDQKSELVDMYFCDVRQILIDMRTISMSKFCFPEEISDRLMKWIKSFNQVVFKPKNGSNADNDYKLLIENTEDIIKNEIISKMESFLKISYDELYEK